MAQSSSTLRQRRSMIGGVPALHAPMRNPLSGDAEVIIRASLPQAAEATQK